MLGYVLIGVGVLLLILTILKTFGLFYGITRTWRPRVRLIIAIIVFGLSIGLIIIGVKLI